ncbi:MAG: hypothetical protein AAGJ50_00310 [Pseudomonadota bacterium]
MQKDSQQGQQPLYAKDTLRYSCGGLETLYQSILMQWSKLKQRIEERFAENLKGRLEVFETRYRMGHNHNLGEIWFSLDKEKVYSTSDFAGWQRIALLRSHCENYDTAFNKVAAEGTLPVKQSNDLLFSTLNMSVEDMLTSPAVLVRGLGIADARCGRRRFQVFQSGMETEHPFLQRLFLERFQKGID